jgi:hypothetical protein
MQWMERVLASDEIRIQTAAVIKQSKTTESFIYCAALQLLAHAPTPIASLNNKTTPSSLSQRL